MINFLKKLPNDMIEININSTDIFYEYNISYKSKKRKEKKFIWTTNQMKKMIID